jgi:hypothetical protein
MYVRIPVLYYILVLVPVLYYIYIYYNLFGWFGIHLKDRRSTLSLPSLTLSHNLNCQKIGRASKIRLVSIPVPH